MNTHKQADTQHGFDATEVDFGTTVGTSVCSAILVYVQLAIAYGHYRKSPQYCKLSYLLITSPKRP